MNWKNAVGSNVVKAITIRRCLHLQLTEKGHEFLREVLPPQHNCLHQLWSALSTTEKDQLEQITRKLLSRLDQMEQDGVVLEAMS